MTDSEARRQRRERWREAVGRIAEELGGRRPEPWQLDVAAHLLSLRPRHEVTASVQIWSQTQLCASEIVDEMRADGRINEWGNWPRDESA